MFEAQTLSTADVVEKARLRYWRDMVCDTFVELECQAESCDDFHGALTNTSLLDVRFSTVESAAQKVVRTRAKIAASNHDVFLLSLQTGGRGTLTQDGRIAVLNPGDFALYDTTRPYDLSFSEAFSQLVLRLPREIVSSRLAEPEALTALCVRGEQGVGRMASAFISQLYGQLDHLDAESARRLHGSTVDLIATALVAQMGGIGLQIREPQLLMRQRIRSFIDRELGNPDLTCEMIALHHGISERYLRKLFESSAESVSGWIWRRRLDQAKRDLSDPLLTHLAITSIGYEVGFKDSAHFSRAFKARFGMTPREYRARERQTAV